MKIYDQLKKEHSKENSLKIIRFIEENPRKMEELMECFFLIEKDYRVPQRAAHVVSLCFDRHPEWVEPYLPKLIERLLQENVGGPQKRNILRILQFSSIPPQDMGRVYQCVFERMLNPKEEIAVRAFSFTVLYNITQTHPELKQELFQAIQYILEEPNSSAGIQSRGKKILQKLARELKF